MALDRTFLKSRVARRIFGLFFLCALLPIIVFAGLSFIQVAEQLDEQSKGRLQNAVKSVGMRIYERLLILGTEVEFIGSLYAPDNKAVLQPAMEIFGDRLIEKFSGLGIISGAGEYRSLFGRNGDPPELSEAEKQHIYAGNVFLSTQYFEDHSTRILMWKRLLQKQSGPQILMAEIKPKYLWGISDDGHEELPPMTELCVLDQSNHILYSSLPTLVSLPEQVLRNISRNHSGTFELRHEGIEYIVRHWSIFLKPVFYTPKWTVMLSESRAEVLAPMVHFKRTFSQVALLALVIVFLASFIQIRKSLYPVEILKKETKRISEGDFSADVKIDTGDEFELLSDSFNEMSRKIKEGQTLLVQTAKMGAIGQMAAGIVHEINQPMTAIYTIVQMAIMEGSDQQKERLEKLMNAVERLMGIISKFRAFSRRSDAKIVALSINKVIDQVNNLLEHQIMMKKLTCNIEKTEDLPLISGENNSLQQVFTNLIINAMDALEDKKDGNGHIKIKTYVCGDMVCVDVADNGTGIPEDIQKHIFDPFFTTKSVEKGTGLGLAIIQSILHDHKAKINVESREGIGTCFTISFPVSFDKMTS